MCTYPYGLKLSEYNFYGILFRTFIGSEIEGISPTGLFESMQTEPDRISKRLNFESKESKGVRTWLRRIALIKREPFYSIGNSVQ